MVNFALFYLMMTTFIHSIIRLMFFYALLAGSASILASEVKYEKQQFYAREDVAMWSVDAQPLVCRLNHPIPLYGKATFFRRSGDTLDFFLDAKRALPRADQVIIESMSPAWADTRETITIAQAPGFLGNRPVQLNEHLAASVLTELEHGRSPVFLHEGWVISKPAQVVLSSVNFLSAYHLFQQCVEELFPANFDQLERSTVLFETDKTVIRASYLARLQLLVDYMAIDLQVKTIYVDGHTDNIGEDGYNWDLSRKRAEQVVTTLKMLGLTEDQIVMRYHGELLPINNNTSANKRAKNRRVTLRLEKVSL